MASLTICGLSGCGGTSASITGIQIAGPASGALTAAVGDALQLTVIETLSDGTTRPVPATATVTWSDIPTVTALDPASKAANPLPQPGAAPTAFFVNNPGRPDRNLDLPGVVFVSDAGTSGTGTINVSVSVAGINAPSTDATASIAITPAPVGDAARGQTVFGATNANCAACHGATGNGSPLVAGSTTMYMVGSKILTYPAPGLNAAAGNVASDPAWSAPLLAIAARADMRSNGLTLRDPMPDWLTEPALATQKLLTTQDLFDIYAYMTTQTQ